MLFRSGGLVGGEVFSVDSVERWEVVRHVGQEDGDVDDLVPGRAGVFENGSDVREGLVGLLHDVVLHHGTGGVDHVAWNLIGAGCAGADPR